MPGILLNVLPIIQPLFRTKTFDKIFEILWSLLLDTDLQPMTRLSYQTVMQKKTSALDKLLPCYSKNKSRGINMSDQLNASSFSTRQLIKTCCRCASQDSIYKGEMIKGAIKISDLL